MSFRQLSVVEEPFDVNLLFMESVCVFVSEPASVSLSYFISSLPLLHALSFFTMGVFISGRMFACICSKINSQLTQSTDSDDVCNNCSKLQFFS